MKLSTGEKNEFEMKRLEANKNQFAEYLLSTESQIIEGFDRNYENLRTAFEKRLTPITSALSEKSQEADRRKSELRQLEERSRSLPTTVQHLVAMYTTAHRKDQGFGPKAD